MFKFQRLVILGDVMRNEFKKATFECKFDRKYTCNVYRWVGKMKRRNNKDFRKKNKSNILDDFGI